MIRHQVGIHLGAELAVAALRLVDGFVAASGVGQAFYGYNWGDGMADAWEEQMLGLPSESGDSAVVGFHPFYQYVGDTLKYADRDSLPVGRGIKGDGFCNWEEYRGFKIIGDQFMKYTSEQHKRLNPFFKNVMVNFRSDVEVIDQAPGWMGALPDTMAFLVESLLPLEDNAETRKGLRRWVNINQTGAHYPYYSSNVYYDNPYRTTSMPAVNYLNANLGFQNAVVFWSQYRGADSSLTEMQNVPRYGFTWGFRAFGPETHIPNLTKGIIVTIDFMDSTFSAPTDYDYYLDYPDSAVVDSIRLINLVIAHEMGHAIGMPHDSLFHYIMGNAPIEGYQSLDVLKWRFKFTPPDQFQEYSIQSESSISTLKE